MRGKSGLTGGPGLRGSRPERGPSRGKGLLRGLRRPGHWGRCDGVPPSLVLPVPVSADPTAASALTSTDEGRGPLIPAATRGGNTRPALRFVCGAAGG